MDLSLREQMVYHVSMLLASIKTGGGFFMNLAFRLGLYFKKK